MQLLDYEIQEYKMNVMAIYQRKNRNKIGFSEAMMESEIRNVTFYIIS